MRAGNALLDARAIFSALDIPRGAVVVDVGAGHTGHFALHAAEAVGDKGKVFAIDIIRDALSMIASSAALRGLHHVQTLWGDVERGKGVGLADGSADYVLLVHTLHTLRAHDVAAQEVRRIVKPGGRIVVIDWLPLASHAIAPPQGNRIAPEDADTVFTRAGCVRCGHFSPSPAHWGRIYSS